MKTFDLILTVLFIMIIFSSAVLGIFGHKPYQDEVFILPNTKWISEDGSIYFNASSGIGKMNVGGETFDIKLGIKTDSEIALCMLDELKYNEERDYISPDDYSERWVGNFWRGDKLVATVQESKYFEQGKEITLYRVDDEESRIVVYIPGGMEPENITPKEGNSDEGLYFSTEPIPGADMVTIEDLNVSGSVYAIIQEDETVLVKPLGGSMEDWINYGTDSIWTRGIEKAINRFNEREGIKSV